MADAVATLNSVVLARTAKFFRVMEAEGVDWSCFQVPIDSVVARRNLAEFLKKGCLEMIGDVVDFLLTPDISTLLANQQIFYKEFFGLDLGFSNVRIPERRAGFDRLIVMAQGLTPNRVYEACVQHFKCWRCTDDLDGVLDWDQEERNPKDGPYAIWVRDRREADEELKNLLANDIKARAITTETLTERLLHELIYWHETGKHLDTNTITRTSSRDQGSGVPNVHWYDGKLRVNDYFTGHSGFPWRARAVIS